MNAFLKRFLSEDDGSVLVEFAIVGSVFIMCSLAMMDIAHGFYLKNRLDYAADRISRQVMIDPDLTDATLQRPAALDGFDPDQLELSITPITVGDNDYRNIVISYPFSFFSAQLALGGPNLSVTRTIYVDG